MGRRVKDYQDSSTAQEQMGHSCKGNKTGQLSFSLFCFFKNHSSNFHVSKELEKKIYMLSAKGDFE